MKRWGSLLAVLFLVTACAQIKIEEPPTGAVRPSYRPHHYKKVLPADKWNEIYVLDYSQNHFFFPPSCGYRVMHYRDPWGQSQVVLYRETMDGDNFLDVIERRQASDHCLTIQSFYRQAQTLELVETQANCYAGWQWYGNLLRKYYFLRAGNVVYTFCLMSSPKQYTLAEPDFDLFVNDTIDNYLLYVPHQPPSLSPTTRYASTKGRTKQKVPTYFSSEQMLSFFTPVAARNLPSRY